MNLKFTEVVNNKLFFFGVLELQLELGLGQA